jgi:KOW motif
VNEVIDNIKGDKVLVLRGEHQGLRGIIDDIQGDTAIVVFSDGTATLPIALLQNFSSAARKAWRTRPKRAAGRPKDPDLPPKRMVSLRIDEKLWDELGKAVEVNMIRSREAAVNQWLREKLDELWRQRNGFDSKDEKEGI